MGKRRLVTSVTAAAMTLLGVAGPAQAARVNDARDMPADAPDVKQVGVWHEGSRLTVVLKLHEPVPEAFGGGLELDLGGDHLQLAFGSEFHYAELTVDGQLVYEANPAFRNHSTVVFQISHPRIAGQRWRYATNVRYVIWGEPARVDRLRSMRV